MLLQRKEIREKLNSRYKLDDALSFPCIYIQESTFWPFKTKTKEDRLRIIKKINPEGTLLCSYVPGTQGHFTQTH